MPRAHRRNWAIFAFDGMMCEFGGLMTLVVVEEVAIVDKERGGFLTS